VQEQHLLRIAIIENAEVTMHLLLEMDQVEFNKRNLKTYRIIDFVLFALVVKGVLRSLPSQ
jgi:hypothetical protein